MLHNGNAFNNIKTVEDLCSILDISVNQLYYLLFVKKNKYTEFKIPKRNGGSRTILAPTSDLKAVQKKLANVLAESYDFFDVQHGFIKNRSCVSNAAKHIGKRFVLNVDLEDFFDTIHFGRVQGLFMSSPFNFNRQLATFIAKLVCEDKKLPQGAPTSPIISNIICYSMDKNIDYLARKNNCVYTRYADDITISTNSDRFPSNIAYKNFDEVVLSDELIKIISGGYSNGFRVNSSKTKLTKRIMRQEVTGIIVNNKLNLNKRYIKQVRAMLFSLKKDGFINTYKKNYKVLDFITEETAKSCMFNLLQGKLNYLKMVRGYNDRIFIKYAKQFNDLFKCDFFNIDFVIEFENYVTNRCFVIQSQEETSQGTAFLVDGNKLYTSTHIFINDTTYSNFIYDSNNDDYLEQFPIKTVDGKLPFFYLRKKDLNTILYIDICESDYKTDVKAFDYKYTDNASFKISKIKPKINDTVFLIGYPNFYSFDKSRIAIIETKIISISEFLGRKFFVTRDSPKHGMSGGPVVNSKGDVVGIVYAGADLENDYDSNQVGFIDLT